MADFLPATAEPDDGSGQTAALDDDALLTRARRLYRENIDTVRTWRKNAEEDFEFVDGHQWNEKELSKLRDEGRPPISFNKLAKVVDVIVGIQINNGEDISFKPRSDDDGLVCEAATDLVEWVRDGCDAEDEETDAFRDLVVSGMGWLELHVEGEGAEQRLCEQRVDPFEMVWPTWSKARNLEDAPWVMRCKQLDRAEAEAMWPDAADEDLDASWARDAGDKMGDGTTHLPKDSYKFASRSGELPARVTIVEYVWWEMEDYGVASLPVMGPDGAPQLDPQTGQPAMEQREVEGEELLTAMERAPQVGGSVERKRRACCYIAHLGGAVLHREKLPTGRDLIYRAMTGKYDRKDRVWYGAVRHAKDPQRWANKWRSQALHILNTSAKNTLLYEDGVFKDPEKARTDLAKPGATVELEAGSISQGRFQWKESAGFDGGFTNMMLQADSAIFETMGVNPEVLGAQDRQQAGILEVERKKAAVTILAIYFDNLRRVRKAMGRLVMQYLSGGYVPAEELARVLGPEKAQLLPQLLSPDTLEFDVVVDESPASPNAKERNWQLMQPLLATILGMPDLPPEAKLELFKASPVPTSMVEKIESILEQAKPAQEEAQQRQQQLIEADQQAKTNKQVTAADLDVAKAEQIRNETQMAGLELGVRLAEAEVGMMERPQQAAAEREAAGFDRDERRFKAGMPPAQQNGYQNGHAGPGLLPMMLPPPGVPGITPEMSPGQGISGMPPPQPQPDPAVQQLLAAIEQMTQVSLAMMETAQRPRRYVRDEDGNLQSETL